MGRVDGTAEWVLGDEGLFQRAWPLVLGSTDAASPRKPSGSGQFLGRVLAGAAYYFRPLELVQGGPETCKDFTR